MQDLLRCQATLLDVPLVKLVKLVRGNVSSGAVLAPVVVLAQVAYGQRLLVDRLPELALSLVRQRNLVLVDGDDQVRQRVRLALGRREAAQADLFVALAMRVGLVKALG